jgi:hypothetical protein
MGCVKAPSPWLDPRRQGRAGGRTLILGVKQSGEIFAHLATPDSQLGKSYEAVKDAFRKAGVLTDISALLISKKPADEDAELIERLAHWSRAAR